MNVGVPQIEFLGNLYFLLLNVQYNITKMQSLIFLSLFLIFKQLLAAPWKISIYLALFLCYLTGIFCTWSQDSAFSDVLIPYYEDYMLRLNFHTPHLEVLRMLTCLIILFYFFGWFGFGFGRVSTKYFCLYYFMDF